MTPRDPRDRENIDWLHGPPRWAVVRPKTQRELQAWLAKNAQSLHRDGYRAVAAAFHAYLTGRAKSLDEAFGLIKRGRSGPKAGLTLERDIHVLELAGEFGGKRHTWAEIEGMTAGVTREEARKFVAALRKPNPSTPADRNRHNRAVIAYRTYYSREPD